MLARWKRCAYVLASLAKRQVRLSPAALDAGCWLPIQPHAQSQPQGESLPQQGDSQPQPRDQSQPQGESQPQPHSNGEGNDSEPVILIGYERLEASMPFNEFLLWTSIDGEQTCWHQFVVLKVEQPIFGIPPCWGGEGGWMHNLLVAICSHFALFHFSFAHLHKNVSFHSCRC